MRLQKFRCQKCGHWLGNVSLVNGLFLEIKCSKCCAISKLLVRDNTAVVTTDNIKQQSVGNQLQAQEVGAS